MTRNKKNTKQQPTEIPMADNKDVMVITGIKMKYLSLKENEYGHNHFFNVLDITPLQQLIELRKTLMPIWDYNDKFYLKINDIKIKELLEGLHTFQKDVPYIMGITFRITFRKYDFQKNGEQITGYSISEINKTY